MLFLDATHALTKTYQQPLVLHKEKKQKLILSTDDTYLKQRNVVTHVDMGMCRAL